jgi:DNA modification methylase
MLDLTIGGTQDSGEAIQGANLRSVWWVSPAQYGDAHYAVMPERIAEICIVAGCPENGTVLDPFNGAGTTGLVATRLQRNYIGIELNPEYVTMAETRIRQDAPLFNSAPTQNEELNQS